MPQRAVADASAERGDLPPGAERGRPPPNPLDRAPRRWQGRGMDPVEITAGTLHLRPLGARRRADAVHRACSDPDVQRWTRVPMPYPARTR